MKTKFHHIASVLIPVLLITGCTNSPPHPIEEASKHPTEDWHQRLLNDEDYSVTQAIEEYPQARQRFTQSEIVLDKLTTGDFKQTFTTPLDIEDSIKFTIICDSNIDWTSKINPMHPNFLASSKSCNGSTSTETKKLDQKVKQWSLSADVTDEVEPYRIVIQRKGDN